ncbi:MAG: signal recognition particle-docking protein FtsY [Calditrichaeota bacterium]|nr:signal recognition particle-docking protein FtsY [Calditrichota bacterium]
MSVFSKLQNSLAKTRAGLVDGINRVVAKTRRIDEEFLDELEELLILSDIGVDIIENIIDDLRKKGKEIGVVDSDGIIRLLKADLVAAFSNGMQSVSIDFSEKPHVISIVGVNGTGKTTSIGKLANKFQKEGKKVLLAAADTFRAAAIDQLEIWAKRSGADIVQTQPGADPASVAFDALKAAIARDMDILIIDTAGRLHTKTNLIAELEKIHRVLKKQMPQAPHEVLLVMDATTGQNGLAQARRFAQAVDVNGIILTKLDGTAKGGVVFSIAKKLHIPVRFIGLGEKIDDIEVFDPELFVEALFQ